ncbi:hypothetical protein JAAARDRAFT_29720 [Jaapia argillacea MUCL 33604]|uniref:Uncharacterized protein n=1 Tax=Jaapia argillacea MUCL 33604 TaxID=933084 RepID=A0A067QC05_9AGAM|nr:hypothetical protein JAAARDRAFT_29720 [Jaapia argillacea MUCL 33604]
MSPPRPILKRSPATTHVDSSSPPTPYRPRDIAVHFPPSPRLTRTFTAHSPSSYDRSPIVVAPNACALPARGCPGRTYTLNESPTQKRKKAEKSGGNGKHLHPRAVASGSYTNNYDDDLEAYAQHQADEAGDSDPDRTPTCTSTTLPLTLPPAPPPLIPDLSSESEESDGFTSPPPESSLFHPSTSHSAAPISIPHKQPTYLSLDSFLNGANTPTALSFLPHPPSPPAHREAREADKSERRRDRESERSTSSRRDRPHRERSRERERELKEFRERRSKMEFDLEEEDEVDEEGEETEEEYSSHPRIYRSLSIRSSLTTCSLADKDEGCLAGF